MLNVKFVCIKYSKVKSLVVYSLCWYLCCSFHVDLMDNVLLSFIIFWDIENQDAFFSFVYIIIS